MQKVQKVIIKLCRRKKTDKVVNDFFNNIEKTLEGSTKKAADEIKSLNK